MSEGREASRRLEPVPEVEAVGQSLLRTPPLTRLRARAAGVPRDAAWAGASEGSQLVAALCTFYFLTTELGPAIYGLYAGLQAMAATAATLSSASVVMFILQEAIRERRKINDVFPVSLGLALAAGSIMTVAVAGLGHLLLPGVSGDVIVLFTAAEVLGAAGVNLAAGAVQAVEGFSVAARMRTTFLFVRLLAVASLWSTGRLSLGTLTLTLLAVNCLSGAAALVFCSRRLGAPLRVTLPRRHEVRRSMSYGGVLAAFAVQEDGDKTLMVRFGTPVDAGLYAAAYRGVQLVMLPIKALLLGSHNRFLVDDEGVEGQHLRRSLWYTTLAGGYGLIAAAAMLLLAPAIAAVLGPKYAESAKVVRILAPLVLLRAMSLFAFNGLMGLGRNGVRVGIVTLCAVTNVVVNAVLIPRYSWRGAAAATLTTEAVFVVVTWGALTYLQRSHDTQHALRRPAGILGAEDPT